MIVGKDHAGLLSQLMILVSSWNMFHNTYVKVVTHLFLEKCFDISPSPS